MNQRLQQFLELENISPAKLSDILGVQRSNISHILSGRNKPGYDFICKIISRFPTINAEWLLTGKGKPYKESMTSENSSFSFNNGSSSSNNNLSSSQNFSAPIENRSSDTIFGSNPNNSSRSYNCQDSQDYTQNTEDENNTPDLDQIQPSEISKFESLLAVTQKKRRVKRVIIFFDDGSFEELKPEN